MFFLQKQWPIVVLVLALCAITILTVKPYEYNVSSIFHMDERTAEGNPMPAGFIILHAPSYDGAQYYHVARNVPKIFSPFRWWELRDRAPGSYAYQRFLLPLLAFILALGKSTLLPWTFLLINFGALLLTPVLILKKNPTAWLFALALALSPAAMVALHFSLAEPLTILLITAMLLSYREKSRITVASLFLLSLAVLTREVNILFVGYLLGWSVLTKKWRDALLLLFPAIVFLAWHSVIYSIFGNIPFLMSASAHQIPGSAIIDILVGNKGYNRLTITSIALFMAFVLPCLTLTVITIIKKKSIDVLSLGALSFFGLMLVMPDYIWGSITSIGRVITPIYPLTILFLMERGGRFAKVNAILILVLGVGTAIALAFSVFPYSLTN